MELDILRFILAFAGTVLGIVWCVLYTKRYRYEGYVEALDEKEYFLKDYYGIGYAVIDFLKIDFTKINYRDKERKIAEIKGKKFARFYLAANYAAMFTYIVTFSMISMLFAAASGKKAIGILGIILAVLLGVYVETDYMNKVSKRHEEILLEFPHALSQMALLVNAGMPLRDAIAATVENKESILYDELRIVLDDMSNGKSDIQAMMELNERCDIAQVKKLTNLIIQNIQKGSSEFGTSLVDLSGEIWKERISQVKEMGEKASAKMMLPIMIIFIGILMMVMVPFLSGLSI